MKLFKILPVATFGAISLLAGCGDNGNNPEGSYSAGAAELPSIPSFDVSNCQAVNDAQTASQLEAAKANIADVLKDLGKGNFKDAQVISAQTKAAFKNVLDRYPGNCEAQLGYALGIVTDLVNNAEIKAFIDTVTNKKNLADMDVDDFNTMLITADGRLLTSMAQTAMAQAIPSVDSAIIYMKNIVGNSDFTCSYTYENRTYELDRGEFAPALGALYVAKSALTFGAALNIDFSDNGNYDWLVDMDRTSDRAPTARSVNQLSKLFSRQSSFSTVYDAWKPAYRNIPNLLDSAILFVEVGLQHGINEAKSGFATQLNDPYIVGDDEMSDVSIADFQKAIDSLEHYRKALYTGVEVTLPQGSKITVNVAKFFEITDGFQDYLPYHVINDASEWNTPVDNFGWTPYFDGGYAEYELENTLRPQFVKETDKDYYFYVRAFSFRGLYGDDPYGLYDDYTYEWLTIHYEGSDGNNLYITYDYTIDNCIITFKHDSYDDEIVTEAVPAPTALSSAVCKVENGKSYFARGYSGSKINPFYFTDASGNKTISWQGLNNGYIKDGLVYEYSIRDYGKYIFFPDITFGGVLPGMTADAFWNILATEDGDEPEIDTYNSRYWSEIYK